MLATAAEQGRVLISADTDFGELLAIGQLTTPSVLLLRGTVRRPQARAQAILDNLASFEADVTDGAIVVIGDQRIRIRRLPLEK